MTFGQNLQQHRKDKGLSQEALANQLFVTRQSVSQWENDRTMPSVDLLLKLSGIFGTTVDALLGKPETESIPQPISSVNILTKKKDIRAAMRSVRNPAATVLISVALLLGVLCGMILFFKYNIYNTRYAFEHTTWDFIYRYGIAALLCLLAGITLMVIGIILTKKAAGFGTNHPCSLRFFYDHLEIEEENAEPLSLFYANIRSITETDAYFILKMQNKSRLCVYKRDVGNADELSKLLKSTPHYRDRRLCKTHQTGGKRLVILRIARDFLFVSAFFTLPASPIIFGWLNTFITENQPLRVFLFLLPILWAAAVAAAGIVLVIRHVKALRLIIAGGTAIIVCAVFSFIINNANVLYDLQNERITSESFTDYMEAHGMTVDNTIKGREELYITSCLTAHPENNAFSIMLMEFDEFTQEKGLFSALETFGDLKNKIRSTPRLTTRYTTQDLTRYTTQDFSFNAFYTETTGQNISYVSINEYTVIYFEVPIEKEAQLRELLKDWELQLPY